MTSCLAASISWRSAWSLGVVFFFQAEDCIRCLAVTGVQTCALPISEVIAAAMLANAAMTSVLALYLGSEFGVTERTIGYVFLYVGIFSVAMRSAMIGPIVDRIGELWSIRAGTASLVVGLIGYSLARNFVTLALIIPLVPIGLALLFPATTALMSRSSERSELGTTMGTAQTFAGLARVIAPLFSTMLFQHVAHG